MVFNAADMPTTIQPKKFSLQHTDSEAEKTFQYELEQESRNNS